MEREKEREEGIETGHEGDRGRKKEINRRSRRRC